MTSESVVAKPKLVPAIVAAAFFMQNLDGSVITTAIPSMARSMGVAPTDLSVGITAYILSMAAFVPVSGWLADRLGTRTVFASAVTIFTIASFLCGQANSLLAFTFARVLQGFGGAMMMPVGRLIVLRSTPNSDLLRAISVITWPGLIGPVIGPLIGGAIATYTDWRWIFYINIPLGLTGFWLIWTFVPNHTSGVRHAFDSKGFVLVGVALVALLHGLDVLSRSPSQIALTAVFLVVGFGFGGLAVHHLRRHKPPLIDLSPLSIRTFAISSVGTSTAFRAAIAATPFLLPLFFQIGMGLNAAASGALIMAYFAGNLGMKAVTTPIIKRFRFRPVLVANGLIAGISILLCGFFSAETPSLVIVAVLLVAGLSRSMQFTSFTTLAFADVPDRQRGAATTVSSMMQQISMCLGTAGAALVLSLAQTFHGTPTLSLADFRIAFVVAGLSAIVAAMGCLALKSDDGAEISGHNRAYRPPRANPAASDPNAQQASP